MQFLQIYLRINYKSNQFSMQPQLLEKQQANQSQNNQSHMFSSVNSYYSQNNRIQDTNSNRDVLGTQLLISQTQHIRNNDEVMAMVQERKSKIRRIQSFHVYEGNVGHDVEDRQGRNQEQSKKNKMGYSHGLGSITIKSKKTRMNPQARNLQSIYPTYPANRLTPTNTQNFHVPTLDHTHSHPHAAYQIQLRNDLAQHENYTYFAILLFLVFIVCAIMPAQELYKVFLKIFNLGIGAIGLLIGIIQLIWEYLL